MPDFTVTPLPFNGFSVALQPEPSALSPRAKAPTSLFGVPALVQPALYPTDPALRHQALSSNN